MRRFQTIFAFTLLSAFPPVLSSAQPPVASPPPARLHSGKTKLKTRLTQAQRAQIARELVQNSTRAAEDAKKAAPVTAVRGTSPAAAQENHQTHLSILFKRRYDRQTCAKDRITYDDMVAINREAIDNSLKR